ncbi:MAG TPA: N-acetyltransferase [Hyphomicrobiaceae bacterium]|nr:N-acetyltransferase [Hyphomicrobiaceae bacterium]
MVTALQPYRAERYDIGAARDGRPLALQPITAAMADRLGEAIAQIGPWAHYAIADTALAEAFKSTGTITASYQIECAGESAGAVVIRPQWLVGAYLQMLAVLPAFQGQGIGTRVVAWFEAEARLKGRSAWLCVSAFNPGAQRLYRTHGFELVARLADLVRDGDDELLMRKRLK